VRRRRPPVTVTPLAKLARVRSSEYARACDTCGNEYKPALGGSSRTCPKCHERARLWAEALNELAQETTPDRRSQLKVFPDAARMVDRKLAERHVDETTKGRRQRRDALNKRWSKTKAQRESLVKKVQQLHDSFEVVDPRDGPGDNLTAAEKVESIARRLRVPPAKVRGILKKHPRQPRGPRKKT